jgi:hypothetical protein
MTFCSKSSSRQYNCDILINHLDKPPKLRYEQRRPSSCGWDGGPNPLLKTTSPSSLESLYREAVQIKSKAKLDVASTTALRKVAYNSSARQHETDTEKGGGS